MQEDVDGRDERLETREDEYAVETRNLSEPYLTENMTKLCVMLPGALVGLRKSTADVLSPPMDAMRSQKSVKRRMTEKALGWLIMELALPDMDDFVSSESMLSDMESISFLTWPMAAVSESCTVRSTAFPCLFLAQVLQPSSSRGTSEGVGRPASFDIRTHASSRRGWQRQSPPSPRPREFGWLLKIDSVAGHRRRAFLSETAAAPDCEVPPRAALSRVVDVEARGGGGSRGRIHIPAVGPAGPRQRGSC